MTAEDSAAPAPYHAALSRLAGTWRTQGRVRADGRVFDGQDRYDWVSGGHFLLHSWDVAMPDGRTTGIEVIGPDADGNAHAVHVYDDHGQVSRQSLSIDGDDMRIDAPALRFRGRFDTDGRALEGVWESQETAGAHWAPLMDVRLVRQD